MREIDRRAIQKRGMPGAVLMENAGCAVFEAVRDRYGPMEGKPATIYAGTGNNGGDGFVTARYLHQAGAQVEVRIAGDASKIEGDAKSHLDKLIAGGILPSSGPVHSGIKIDAL